MSLRSPMGRVLGKGAAKDGTDHWWSQRISAVALIPLTLWFLFSLLALPDLHYETVRSWLALPINTLLAVILVAVLAFHSNLGTRVIVEDYVHARATKIAALLLLQFLYVLVAGAGILAILHIAWGS